MWRTKSAKGIIIILMVVFFLGVSVKPNLGEEAKYTVAIVDFNNLSGKILPNIGQVTNEVLGTLLYEKTDLFTIVERTKLLSIMEEQHLSLSGLADSEKSALQLGKLLSADYIITGSIISYEQKLLRVQAYGVTTDQILCEMNVNVKILNVNTGKIEFALMSPAQQKILNTDGAVTVSSGNTRELLIKALGSITDKLIRKIGSQKPAVNEKIMISFNSNPGGADIEIDQVFYGNTPSKIPLNPGLHEIKISLAGYEPWVKRINAFDGLAVSCTLEKKKN